MIWQNQSISKIRLNNLCAAKQFFSKTLSWDTLLLKHPSYQFLHFRLFHSHFLKTSFLHLPRKHHQVQKHIHFESELTFARVHWSGYKVQECIAFIIKWRIELAPWDVKHFDSILKHDWKTRIFEKFINGTYWVIQVLGTVLKRKSSNRFHVHLTRFQHSCQF